MYLHLNNDLLSCLIQKYKIDQGKQQRSCSYDLLLLTTNTEKNSTTYNYYFKSHQNINDRYLCT